MRALAKVGFNQSYTYFTWKNARWELERVRRRAADDRRARVLPPELLRQHARHPHRVPPARRAAGVRGAARARRHAVADLRHLLRLRELRARRRPARQRGVPGLREVRGASSARLDGPLLPLIARLNQVRREHPALQHLDNIRFLETENDALIAYAKRTDRNVVLTVVEPRPARRPGGPGRRALPTSAAARLHGDRPARRRPLRLARRAATTSASRPASAPATSCGWTPRERRAATGAEPRREASRPHHWFETDPLWFKRAVFYEIHLRGFFDGNGDGSGDFRGLTEKLDYLQWLGIDCIWLLPIYASPLRDGGYDIADFYAVHPDYGTIEDVRDLHRGRPRARDPRHRRPRHEPHLVRPPVVPAGAAGPGRVARARLVRLVGHRRTATRTRGSSSSTPRRRTGRGTRRPARTTGTASSPTSPT